MCFHFVKFYLEWLADPSLRFATFGMTLYMQERGGDFSGGDKVATTKIPFLPHNAIRHSERSEESPGYCRTTTNQSVGSALLRNQNVPGL